MQRTMGSQDKSHKPEVVTISNVKDLCGLSPINLMRRSNALFGRAADQYAAILFFHDSRCWPRCGRRLLVATRTRAMAPYFGLSNEPMGGRIQNYNAEGG
jgi:hypothetical protein